MDAHPLYVQTNLVSDIPGMAATPDPHLKNPWGLSAGAKSPFWVSNNNDGTSTLYTGQGAIVPLVVTIPTNTITTPPTLGSPTGTVANTFGSGFDVKPGDPTTSAFFLFDTEDGQIDAWAGGKTATVKVTNNNAGFKGLTLGTDSNGNNLLYAADFTQGTIDVYDQNFLQVQGAAGGSTGPSPIKLKGNFNDPNLPKGYAPFNIQELNGNLYVEYAIFDPTTTEGLPGKGLGIVDVYSNDGVLLTPKHLIKSGGVLNAPWGVALAPANFGGFSNDLLVGNFGDGRINAFDSHGNFEGTLKLANGQPFQEDDLWALRFGNGATDKAGNIVAPTTTLYFTAGINDEKDGLFGSLQAVPTIPKNSSVLAQLPNAPEQTFSTVPANGDVNPYGVAFVPKGFEGKGVLNPGDLLVSNFNNSDNVQGTGATIVRITPDGQQSVFFQGTGLGLTTALGVLKGGFVIVGNVPTDANGVAQQGSLIILDANGKPVGPPLTDAALLNGPWDLTINDHDDSAQVFVSNVLSGTVTRIDLAVPDGGVPKVKSMTQIASGYLIRTDPNALVVGPTGLAFDAKTDTLYVASTGDNAIFAIANAAKTHHDHGTGKLIYNDPNQLHGPLGLVLAPNGDLILSNGDAVNPDASHSNELVEITRTGKFVSSFQLDNGGPGGAFGIALSSEGGVIRFAAVDDITNTLQVWTLQTPAAHSFDFDPQHHRHGGFDNSWGEWWS
jgi:uncharacterized protein (TIGR03118 family)